MGNVLRLVPVNESYEAAWWKVLLAAFFVVFWSITAWRLARKAGREDRELQIEHGGACARKAMEGFARQSLRRGARLKAVAARVKHALGKGSSPYRGDPAHLVEALEKIRDTAGLPDAGLDLVDCNACEYGHLCPNPRDPRWACATLGYVKLPPPKHHYCERCADWANFEYDSATGTIKHLPSDTQAILYAVGPCCDPEPDPCSKCASGEPEPECEDQCPDGVDVRRKLRESPFDLPNHPKNEVLE